ncbi:MAG: hypothetical protein Q9181_001221 [Wetmoreana brouardii]
MPPTRSKPSSARRVTDSVNNAHVSAAQPRARRPSRPDVSGEATKNRQKSLHPQNPGPLEQGPQRPTSTSEESPSKRWRVQGYVNDSEDSELETEVEEPQNHQALPAFTRFATDQPDSFSTPRWNPLPGKRFKYLPQKSPQKSPQQLPQHQVEPGLPHPVPNPTDSFESVATDPLSEGHYEKKGKAKGKKADKEWGFLQKGRLPRDDPRLSMDDQPTQPANIPPIDPREKRGHLAGLSEHERSDILCILHPSTPAAYRAVQLVAESAPQHILEYPTSFKEPSVRNESVTQHESQSDQITTDPDQMTVDDGQHTEPKGPPLDIALRLTSKLLNPTHGFAFGRDPSRCDLVISSKGRQQRVSGVHFRIFVSSKGSLMCHDTSTNGTWVDSQFLRAKKEPTEFGPQSTIHHGSCIELMLGEKTDTGRFIVSVPERENVSEVYGRKLNAYINYVAQLERQKKEEARRKSEGIPMEAPPVPMPPFAEVLQAGKLSDAANKKLVAGTEPYHHGMHWNGGDSYKVTGEIGKGAFATVYKLTRRHDGEIFAVKEVKTEDLVRRGVLDRRVEQELKIMQQLKHPNIVQYIDHHEFSKYLYIIMELVPYGDLQSCLGGGRPRLEEYHCQAVASQMCQALKYLHDCKITHRDIKPDNILIYSTDPYIFKLSDFGLSKVITKDDTFLKTFCGTLLYCAPEVYPGYDAFVHKTKTPTPRKRRRAQDGRYVKQIPDFVIYFGLICISIIQGGTKSKQPYTSAVDTWGLAAVLYHLLCGSPPFTGTMINRGEQMLDTIVNTPINWNALVVSGVSPDAVDFLKRMLVVDSSLRPSDVECLQHPWISTDLLANDSAEDLGSYTEAPLEGCTTRDTERADPAELSAFASQLSIRGNPTTRKTNVRKDLTSAEPGDSQMSQSKRKREGEGSDEEISQVSLAEYDDDLAPSKPPAKKMYGEIDPSALRSSGTLGRNVHAALGLPAQEHLDSVMSDSHYEGESEISINDFPNPQGQPAHPNLRPEAVSGGAAPSLYGAEAMVGELNMDSPIAGAPSQETNDLSWTSKTEYQQGRKQRSKIHSRNSSDSSQGLYSATPPQSPKHKKAPASTKRESEGSSLQPGSRAEGGVKPQSTDRASKAGYQAKNQQMAATADNSGEKGNNTTATAAVKPNIVQQNQPLTTQPPPAGTPSSSTTKGTEPGRPTATAPPSTNLPPPFTDLGTLTPLPSSVSFPTIHLTDRTTTFGRHPVSNYVWPDSKDMRVPKHCFDIIFFRPGIDHDLKFNPQLNWRAFEDITAIITTRTSQSIWINGVGLRRGTDCYMYGKLFTGDVITVFEPQPGNKALMGKESEELRLKVDIKAGKSREKRKDGVAFEVIVDKERFEKEGAKMGESREGSVKSGDGNEGQQATHGAQAPPTYQPTTPTPTHHGQQPSRSSAHHRSSRTRHDSTTGGGAGQASTSALKPPSAPTFKK